MPTFTRGDREWNDMEARIVELEAEVEAKDTTIEQLQLQQQTNTQLIHDVRVQLQSVRFHSDCALAEVDPKNLCRLEVE